MAKVYSKRFRFSEGDLLRLQRIMKGMDKRKMASMPELSEKEATQTDAIFAALKVYERILIEEGYISEEDD
ncbi:hypothetical protein [Peribacillus sp. TH24]|uniref:hypothetical protein n=1 Tax=Peribacillus sp. TH24 TaxID=2798483 RepID=UPI001912BA3B|nr:hypothetical protein [Peribacillus sp. TH24]MBK5447050.1 hypothetical protein [Peribacillus sp. TH24]MBK5447081.1 hypothetical protein [Peribacillus sp. TH24]